MNFSERLKQIRTKKGLTKSYMAKELNIPYTTYRNYEEGREPRISIIQDIAKVLDIPYTDLLDSHKAEFWKETDKTINRIVSLFDDAVIADTENEKRILELMNQLNEIGQEKALDQMEMLTKIEEYKK